MNRAKGTVLVVDDEPNSLRLMLDILTKEGFEVRPADSGELALASAAANAPELIVLDIHMPGMNGFEVCRRLKEHSGTRDIPVMFISAATAVEEHVECFRVGGVAFVNKPLVPEEVVARVRAHLELGRLRRRLEQQVAERTAALETAYNQLERELTDREQAEMALRESEERFRNMADTAPVMIWVAGTDQRATFVNKEWLNFRGRTMGEELGDHWIDALHPEDRERCVQIYSEAFEARGRFEMEYRAQRADGEYRWLMDCGVPRFTPDGEFAGYIGSCSDITELKRIHEQRLAAQKMESLGVLAAGIAHDFNNLLGSILAEADLAGSAIPEGSGSREHIERISAVAIRASEIVDLLMAYAGTKDAPALNQVNVSEVAGNVIDLMRPSLPRNAVLCTDLSAELPAVRSHAPELRRIAINLLRNAAEALEGSIGSITVSTGVEHVEQDGSFAGGGLISSGDYVRLTVSDTGRGMSEETIARAFDPFYTTKFLGRGLGLSVVQGIVRSHGGAVRVSSKPAAGTTFDVLLPCAGTAAPAPPPDSAPLPSGELPARGGTVLLVEDETILRGAVKKGLEKRGFTVTGASDGENALQLFQSQPFDAVLLDLTLPGIAGLDVYRELTRMKPELPVILTSGYDLSDPKWAEAAAQGSAPFLRKPYRIGDVTNLLDRILDSHYRPAVPDTSDRQTS